MNIILRVFLAAGLLLGAAEAQAENEDLAAYLETVRTSHALPALAAAVVQDGEVIASGAVGVRALGTDVPVTIDDRFHLGSDTKAMTATLAGMMVDEGRLRWDSTIGEVLGDKVQGMNPALAAVTLEQLLSHTSGIPTDNQEIADIYFNVDAFDFNLGDLRIKALEAWKANKPEAPAGTPFQYSNLGYMIAGAMIEAAAGQPWEELIYARIFEPLGLATAGLGPQATFGKLDAPVGHRMADDIPTATAPVGGSSNVTPMLWGPPPTCRPCSARPALRTCRSSTSRNGRAGTRARESAGPRSSSRRRSNASTGNMWTSRSRTLRPERRPPAAMPWAGASSA